MMGLLEGILRDYGIDFLNQSNYTGTALHDSNYVGMDEWRMIYAGLYSAQIANAGMPQLSAINATITGYNTADQPISFAGLHYNYQQLRDDAVTGNMMTVSNDQLYDVANRAQSPYQTMEAFAFAPVRQAIFTGTTSFIFRQDLFYTNTGKTVSSISVDPNGGSSYQPVAWGVPFTISYSTTGFKNVNIQVTYTDGTVRYSHTKLAVYQSASTPAPLGAGKLSVLTGILGLLQYGDNGGTRLVANQVIPAIKPYLGTNGSAVIDVQLSVKNSTNTIRKPLIIVEGFDPTGGYNFFNLTESLSRDENFRDYVPISLNNGLDDINQYDLVFVRWRNSTDYIQRNAFALEEVIRIVDSAKTTWNGVRQQNVIIGMSMGGLVVRYALRDMELNNLPHDTRLFISHDAPHNGANVPAAAQAAVQQFASWKLIGFTWGGGLFYNDMVPQVADAMNIFNSPAAKQMLMQRYILGAGNTLQADNSTHTAFMNEINNMGWPANCRTVLLGNGSCNGTKIFPDNSDIITVNGDKSMTYLGSLWRSFCLSLAGGVGGASDIATNSSFNAVAMLWQFPLALFSSSSNIKTEFILRSVPANGAINEIYRGDVYSSRKVLWLIPVTTYFTKCHVNSTSDMLPLDNAPGGEYNLNQFGFDVSMINNNLPTFLGARATVVQANFCFVPTVSSLAFTNFSQNLTAANVCDIAACQKPSGVSDYYAPTQNQFHISYTQPGSDWLLQQQDAGYNCSKMCNAPSISGPEGVCNSSTYKVENLPPGMPVTWTLDGGGATLTMAPAGNNMVTLTNMHYYGITATLKATTSCFTLTKQVKTANALIINGTINQDACYGKPAITNMNLLSGTANMVYGGNCPVYVQINSTSDLQISPAQQAAISSMSFYRNSSSTYMLYFLLSTGTASFTITQPDLAADCGTKQIVFMSRSDSKQSLMLSVSPNPATSVINIDPVTDDASSSTNVTNAVSTTGGTLQTAKVSEQGVANTATVQDNVSNTASGEVYTAELTDVFTGKTILTQKNISTSKRSQLHIGHLKKGQYFLVIKNSKGEIVKKQQMILQ